MQRSFISAEALARGRGAEDAEGKMERICEKGIGRLTLKS
jgi:hypothetical protein